MEGILFESTLQLVCSDQPTRQEKDNMKRHWMKITVTSLMIAVLFVSCLNVASNWTRRDMPTSGLTHLVTYSLVGPAGSKKEINEALLRGVNDHNPGLMQQVRFGKMSGTKTQDVITSLPNGTRSIALGMTKTKRHAGLTNYATLEPATYYAQDINGNTYCGVKVRLDFNRNLVQYTDLNKRDFQSLWYYDVPCSATTDSEKPIMDMSKAKLRAVVLNEIWQARVATGSFFFNWGHSVTIIDGLPTRLSPGWWEHWDLPDEKAHDTLKAIKVVNQMVHELEKSSKPWLEFTKDGAFAKSGSWIMYSAGDADQYANFQRIVLDRQKAYTIFYRPNVETSWDYILVEPIYNYEWNDVLDHLWTINSWSGKPSKNKLFDENGMPRNDSAMAQVKEIEKIGWMNAPNASLEQIRWSDSEGNVLYTMTVRAHIGAADSLIIFGRGKPNFGLRKDVGVEDRLPMPQVYDENGKLANTQPWNAERWAEWQREASFWNFLKDNPYSVSADLMVQYRFEDASEWKPIYCRSDSGNYVCGHSPVEWNLSASYYMDGNPETPWYVIQTLGEVGMRTLGLSYCSGLFKGTGFKFALDQRMFKIRFDKSLSQEDVWLFDARAMQLPDTMAKAWKILHQHQ